MTAQRDAFHVTTPIYYVNDLPHIGHAYSTVAADVLARYQRMRGRKVYFQTGTDEHGQKVQAAAAKRGLDPKAHADGMVGNFISLWGKLDISNSAFIRTTDPEHKEIVRELLNRLWEEKKIVKRSYSGWYCTPDERFWTEKDLVEGKCPDCGREVEKIEEENYFFLMSEYRDQLVKHIEENPGYIMPETRRNEVMGFLKQPLGDLCISRPKARLAWGIPLPFDENFVTYVWFDALVNYYSGTRYLAKDASFWPASLHIIGKDILTTHAVYWSTMLMALGLPLPERIFAHGWWTVAGRKMSKSLGNVVDPADIIEKYGADAFRYFLMREVPFGLDGDFSEEALVTRINSDLANDLGNLLSRSLTMIEKYRGGAVPERAESKDRESAWETVNGTSVRTKIFEKEIQADLTKLHPESGETYLQYNFRLGFDKLEFHNNLMLIWAIINKANKYIEDAAPWKEKDEGRLSNVLYTLAETLRLVAVYVSPFMPSAAREIWGQLGIKEDIGGIRFDDFKPWGGIKPGTKVQKGAALFPRIDLKKTREEKKKEKKVQEETKAEPKPADNLIGIEDFARVELKTGRIVKAEAVQGSNKLIRLEVDTGELRQVVAGIGKAYKPEDLVGRTVAVVTNLKPAKLMGVESHGMLLAASGADGQPSLLSPDRESPPGARIK